MTSLRCPVCKGRITRVEANPGECNRCGSLLKIEDNPSPLEPLHDVAYFLRGREKAGDIEKAEKMLGEHYGAKFELRLGPKPANPNVDKEWGIFKDGRRIGTLEKAGGVWGTVINDAFGVQHNDGANGLLGKAGVIQSVLDANIQL